MIDAPSQAIMQELIRRESRSLLQYVDESYPWEIPDSEDPAAWAQVKQLLDEESEGLAVIGQFLIRHHALAPYLASYPMAFTNYNNVSLAFLLPQLIAYQRRNITELERDFKALTDAEARTVVQSFREMKWRHLQKLEQLAAPTEPSVV